MGLCGIRADLACHIVGIISWIVRQSGHIASVCFRRDPFRAQRRLALPPEIVRRAWRLPHSLNDARCQKVRSALA